MNGNSGNTYTHEMSQAWARQLHNEFAQICYQYSLALDHPVIELFDSDHRLGAWQRSSRTISINRQVIIEHGWDAVIQVLKHEMAHQICDEVFGGGETAHDRFFHRACEMLGLPRQFAKARIDRNSLLETGTQDGARDDGRTKLIEKVRKVLALAHSANEHEARLALETSVRLMRRHALAQSEIEFQDDDVIYRIISLRQSRVSYHQRLIASLLSRHFGVRLVCSRLYDAAADKICRTFEIFGSREHVAVAEHCYYFLEGRLSALWREHRRKMPDSRARDKGSYYCGVLHGFEQRLTSGDSGQFPAPETISDSGSGGKAWLPVPFEQLIDASIRRRHPRLHTAGGRKTRVNRDVYTSGKLAGREIRLRSAVSSAHGGGGDLKLLGTTSND
jgi:predicted SprT family Zn-dependent metalloprotease